MAATQGPRRMQIAQQLVAERKRAGLTQEQAAARADLSKSTVSRYEDWQDPQGIVVRTVKALCEAYETPAEVREELLLMVRQLGQPDWWVADRGVPQWMRPFVSLEDEVALERDYSALYFPGLLQTHDYAVATHLALDPMAAPDEVAAHVDARMRRQEVLNKGAKKFRFWGILDEAVLRRPVGGRQVHRQQIDHVLEQSERPNVTIQVLPFSQGAHAAVTSFVLLGGADDAASAAYVEMLRGGLFFDKAPELRDYVNSFEQICSQAASMSDSRKILAQASKEFA